MNQFLELPDSSLIRLDIITAVMPLDAIPDSDIGERIRIDFNDNCALVYFNDREERDAFVRYIKSELAGLV